MAWEDCPSHNRLSHAGCPVAGTRSSAAVSRRHEIRAPHPPVAAEVPDCLGTRPPLVDGGDHTVARDLERTLRRMKKILITIFQLAVTIALLFLVYHDPNKRREMWQAVSRAKY